MKLPGGERAVVDLVKLIDYCLSDHHPRGRHKARVFAATLGIGRSDASWLRANLLAAAMVEDASLAGADEHGERYVIEANIMRGARSARIRSLWIVRKGEAFPRFVSCYVV